MLKCPGPVGYGIAPLVDLRFEDLLVGFERLGGFEMVDFLSPLPEPLVEGVLGRGELLQGRARIAQSTTAIYPWGRPSNHAFSSRMPRRPRDASYSLRRLPRISSKMFLASSHYSTRHGSVACMRACEPTNY